jgi:exodeoxyribonuclease V alpha subunit
MTTSAHDTFFAQAFADQCRRWAAQAGAAGEVVETAGKAGWALVEAIALGDTCLALEENGLNAELLLASGIARQATGTLEAGHAPLVLDEANRLYLARHFKAEMYLAASLLRRHRHLPPPPGLPARRMLETCFPGAIAQDEQKLAVALALCRRFTVISGGPGTGKTTTVARLLACLLADVPQSRILLTAPTGKAAARLQESLLAAKETLPADIAERLPRHASTLHRLLGFGAKGQAPLHHSGNPLEADTLVVDEASMLDLHLALRLCEALPARTRLILLGDRNQLQAVEAGAIFAALSESAALTQNMRQQLSELAGWPEEALSASPYGDAPGPLADSVIWLTKSYRFAGDSPLGRLSLALAEGDGERALKCFAINRDLQCLEAAGPDLSAAEFDALRQGYAPYARALEDWRNGARDPAALFAAFEAFRVLCVTRQGARGVQGVNERLLALFRQSGDSSGFFSPWGLFPGAPLMILKNDPVSRLFNGDIGIALLDEQGFQVYFPDESGGYRALSPARLPAWEIAFAMTVHKSQGSEFQRVALVLPEKDMLLLTRELVYTAATRARQGLLLLGQSNLLLRSAAKKTRRQGGLSARLMEKAVETAATQVTDLS